MGIDMRLHLVDGDVLLDILKMDWSTLISKINDLSIRTMRPTLDPKLNLTLDKPEDLLKLEEWDQNRREGYDKLFPIIK